jgi:pimeloyl-ACP methyl ester carboxylesterase
MKIIADDFNPKGGTAVPQAKVNDITIAYETIGSENDRPLLLITGLASQMVTWPDAFCSRLVDAGHFVIRFDNRDCGLSSKLESGGVPNVETLMADAQAGKPVKAPYRLSDMAADAVGLLDKLGLDRAHVCGLSMGGMIAQLMAVEYPDRVASLISMMSTTGRPGLPGPTPEAMQAMLSMPPIERSAYVRYLTGVYRAFAGGSEAFDEQLSDAIAGQAYDRSFYLMGFARQMAAIIASGNREEKLSKVTAPTLVIHGTSDSLVPIDHGRATADAIPGAELVLIEQLGHGLTFPTLWDEIIAAIASRTRSAAV